MTAGGGTDHHRCGRRGSNRYVFQESLTDSGFSARLFSDATSALQIVDDPEGQAALIDVGLPGTLGDQLARDIHTRRPLLPIILMTGYDEQRYEAAFATDQYVRVLGKPFGIPRLLLKLEAFGIYGDVQHTSVTHDEIFLTLQD